MRWTDLQQDHRRCVPYNAVDEALYSALSFCSWFASRLETTYAFPRFNWPVHQVPRARHGVSIPLSEWSRKPKCCCDMVIDISLYLWLWSNATDMPFQSGLCGFSIYGASKYTEPHFNYHHSTGTRDGDKRMPRWHKCCSEWRGRD